MADAIGSEAVVRQDESVLRRGCRVIYYKFVVLTPGVVVLSTTNFVCPPAVHYP